MQINAKGKTKKAKHKPPRRQVLSFYFLVLRCLSLARNFLRDIWNDQGHLGDSGLPPDLEYFDPVTRDKR